MKKTICIVIFLAMLLSLVSCVTERNTPDTTASAEARDEIPDDDTAHSDGNDTQNADESNKSDEDTNTTSPITYSLNHYTPGIKILGVRNFPSDTQINCDWTGAGLEMNVEHNGGSMVFKYSSTSSCIFRAYVDGEPYSNVSATSSIISLMGLPAGVHNVKLVKATENYFAMAQIVSVTFDGKILEQTPTDKNLYIEFVGDSISCGWGIIGNHTGSYTDQDGTLAYPYMVAQELNTDYSITAISGKGVAYGTPNLATAYLYGNILRSTDTEYTFERKADLVVINLGTNDYAQQIPLAQFKEAYEAFIDTVKQKNGDSCKILCIYNTMNDTYSATLTELCGDRQDEGIYLLKIQRAAKEHPTDEENKAYTEFIVDYLTSTVFIDQ